MAHGQQVESEKNGKSEQAKKSQTNKVGHRSKLWLIETTNNEEGETTNDEEGEATNNEEGEEYGVDYQDDDNTEPVCSSDKHGSVGLAIDTTS